MGLLISEPPLQVLPSLATKIGLNEAIFIQQVHYWLLKSDHIIDGHKWIYNSATQWQEQFKFWSHRTIQRIIDSLEKEGIIISGCFNVKKSDRTKWYRIDYKKVEMITTDCRNGYDNLTQPLPENTTETTTTICSRPKESVAQSDLDILKKDYANIYLAYPKRLGANSKEEGFQRYRTMIKNKIATHEEILQAVKKYNDVCTKSNSIGTEYIQQIATFLGPKKKTYEQYINKNQQIIGKDISELAEITRNSFFENLCEKGDPKFRLLKDDAVILLGNVLSRYGAKIVTRVIKQLNNTAFLPNPAREFNSFLNEILTKDVNNENII